MARFGVDLSGVTADTGGMAALPDEGVQDFEITDIKNGVQAKGKNAGAPYFSAKCVQVSGETPGVKSTSKFLGMGTVPFVNGSNQQAQTKGFVEQIGLGNELAQMGAEFDTDLLKGVTFRANVVHKPDANNRPQAELYDVEAISHAGGAQAGQPANAPAAPTPATAPAAASAQATPPTEGPKAAPAAGRRRR